MAIVVRAVCWELTLALVLWLLAPSSGALSEFASHPQQYVDRHGADEAAVLVAALVLTAICVVVALAVVVAAVSALGQARPQWAIPVRWLQRLAAIMLGIAVLPAAACGPLDKHADETAVTELAPQTAPPTVIDQFDWPAAGQTQDPPITDVPTPEPSGAGQADAQTSHVPVPGDAPYTVLAGDCLWSIAASHLGPGASLGEIATEVDDIWQLNAALIGPDPNHVTPGQSLVLPPVPHSV